MRFSGATAPLVAAALTVALLGGVSAQCDLSQNVAVGQFYDIYNPNYPNNYYSGTQCRWRASTSSGNRLKLSCGVFQLPASTGCQGDRVRVSLSGDDSLSDAHVYCGQGYFTLVSDANKLTMVLESDYSSSSGGRFLCNITAVSTSSCICGIKKETRIVGGQETGINEYPFMAGLVDRTKYEIYCGATIVSSHYALTAAHCKGTRSISDLGLLVGEHDVSTGDDTSATKLYRLRSFTIHPNYNNDQYVKQDNDIALVRVDGEIFMSSEVMPACLPIRYSSYDFAYSQVLVMGWGTTEYGGAQSNTLQEAELYVQSPSQCSAVHGNSVSYRQMCAYNAGKDACQSDSGGPLYWQDPYTGRIHIVGVVSHGIACATTSPGVNTRVTYYLDWITSVIGGTYAAEPFFAISLAKVQGKEVCVEHKNTTALVQRQDKSIYRRCFVQGTKTRTRRPNSCSLRTFSWVNVRRRTMALRKLMYF